MIRILRILRAMGALFSTIFSSDKGDLDASKAYIRIVELENENRQLNVTVAEKTTMVAHWKAHHDLAVKNGNEWKTRYEQTKAKLGAFNDDFLRMMGAMGQIAPAHQSKAAAIAEPAFVENLLRLCHPDRHSGGNNQVANDVTKKLLELRKELKVEKKKDIAGDFLDDLVRNMEAQKKRRGRR